MSESFNLNSHYSSNLKAQRPERPIVSGPESISSYHLFNDIDANKRMSAINNDIYQSTEKEKSRYGKNFLKVFGAVVLAILAVIGIKRTFK